MIPSGAWAMEQLPSDSAECSCTDDNDGQLSARVHRKENHADNNGMTAPTSPASLASADERNHKKQSWWRWLLFPFRHTGAKITADPCGLESANCSSATTTAFSDNVTTNPDEEMTIVHTRADWGGVAGLLSHRWLEMETSKSTVTIGFGPATIPFIDTGQVGIRDEDGNIKRISGKHPVSFLTLPARRRNYAQKVGAGKEVGEPFLVRRKKADEVIESESAKKGAFLYIPLFNDCRTYVCRLKAKLQGKTGIWCHLLLKGYW